MLMMDTTSGEAGVSEDGKRPRLDAAEDNPLHHAPPSRVLHVRNVADGTESADLASAVARFGPVSYIVMMPRQRQALIEFEEISSAQECVSFATATPILIRGRPAFFNFSKSSSIKRTMVDPAAAATSTNPPNKILLFTVLNPLYPINPDIMQTICTPYGVVERVVMIRKNGVQAMVEFNSLESAQRAFTHLNGADIYSNCCTLKIEYAKCDRLNVRVNGEDTRDFTNPALPAAGSSALGAAAAAAAAAAPAAYAMPPFAANPYAARYAPPAAYPDEHVAAYGAGAVAGPPAVLMVYNLALPHFTCKRLFNLVCNYGNVIKIKILARAPPMAMVQMGDVAAAQAVLENLQGLHVFGQRLELSFSRHPFIAEGRPGALSDGSPAQMDFSESLLNRFRGGAQRHRVARPSPVVHLYNAPPSATPDSIVQLFVAAGATAPVSVKLFHKEGSKTLSGFADFPSVGAATEALVLANHVEAAADSRVFTVKLCFSSQPAHAQTPM